MTKTTTLHTRSIQTPRSEVNYKTLGPWAQRCSCGWSAASQKNRGEADELWRSHLYAVTPKRRDEKPTTTSDDGSMPLPTR